MALRDLLFLPLRFLLSHDQVEALGLTSVLSERIAVCTRLAHPPVLDIGCGANNPFIRALRTMGGAGCGMDIYPFRGVDVRGDAQQMPFRDESFSTATFIGSFNYIEDATAALAEVRRVLRQGGHLLITNTNPLLSRIRHVCAWWDRPQNRIDGCRRYGYTSQELRRLLAAGGFVVVAEVGYLLGLSRLFVAKRSGGRGES